MTERQAPLMTVEQVSEYLGKPVGSLYNWRWRGIGPRAVKVGRSLRYRAADVEAWLDQRTGA